MDVEEAPLDFELEDPLFAAPSPAKTKRKKVIGLDDLLTDHYNEEHIALEKDLKRKISKRNDSDEDEDRTRRNKERELSRLVNDCHKQVHEMGAEVVVPSWGLHIFGSQKLSPPLSAIGLQKWKLFQSFSHDKFNLIPDLISDKEEDFLEGLLKNGWLLNLIYACGCVEDSVASWSFKQMLYSSHEELCSSACDLWCRIVLPEKAGVPSLRPDWLPDYQEMKYALEIYGYIFDFSNYLCSSKLTDEDSGHGSPPMNIKYWVKFAAAICHSRNTTPIFSVSEVEELLSTLVSFFLDRQLQGITFLLDECVTAAINFFTEDEWHISCKKVADSIAYSIPKDLNCLRIVECISQVNARSKNLRSELAFQILSHCFEKNVTSSVEILKFLKSVNMKEKNCDFVKLYIHLVLVENWVCWDPALDEKSTALNMWYKYLRNCSTQITSTDWRPYASKVRNRASYLLQTANPVKCQ